MSLIPKIKCSYCHESSLLTEFMSDSEILQESELGYCPNCDQPNYINIMCTVSASVTPIETQITFLESQLDAWQELRSKQSEDINLIKNQIKFYKNQIKKWSKIQKGGIK